MPATTALRQALGLEAFGLGASLSLGGCIHSPVRPSSSSLQPWLAPLIQSLQASGLEASCSCCWSHTVARTRISSFSPHSPTSFPTPNHNYRARIRALVPQQGNGPLLQTLPVQCGLHEVMQPCLPQLPAFFSTSSTPLLPL